MNPKLHLDQSILIILYFKYKAYLIPLAIILACVFAFFIYIIPQVQQYYNSRGEVTADQATIETLNSNLNTLSALDQTTILNDLTTTVAALPSEKDYTGILNAISSAASAANVGLGDYSFDVGDIGSKNTSANTQLTVEIDLSLTGDLAAVQNFMIILGKEFPMSEVIAIDSRGDDGSNLVAQFFYNPFPQLVFNPQTNIPKLSLVQQKLLHSLSTDYSRPLDVSIPSRQAATESAH